jgi:long-chain fatty acid transport protein
MVDDADRTITLPIGPTWRIAAGAQRQMSERFELGFGYTYASSGSLTVDQERGALAGRVAGSFDSAAIHFFGLNGHWMF